MPHFVASDLGLYSLPLSYKKEAMPKWVNYMYLLLRYRMARITESAMVAYTHKYAEV